MKQLVKQYDTKIKERNEIIREMESMLEKNDCQCGYCDGHNCDCDYCMKNRSDDEAVEYYKELNKI